MSHGFDHRAAFLTAMGEEFGEACSPPIPWGEASPHECYNAVWEHLGDSVSPVVLSELDVPGIAALAVAIGDYFECEPPTVDQTKKAIANTLFRWPVADWNKLESGE